MTKTSKSHAVLAVIAAFEAARAEGQPDREAFETALGAAPSHWKRRTVANMIFNHLGKPTWNDPAFRDLLGSDRERRTYFAFTDEAKKEVYIVGSRRSLTSRAGQLLSKARAYARHGYCDEGPCYWINSVWASGRPIYVWELEIAEAVKPHFSMNYFSVAEAGWLGPRLEYVWSYVAHRAGYVFAEKNWYDKWIPEGDVDRRGMLEAIDERTWPKTPLKAVDC